MKQRHLSRQLREPLDVPESTGSGPLEFFEYTLFYFSPGRSILAVFFEHFHALPERRLSLFIENLGVGFGTCRRGTHDPIVGQPALSGNRSHPKASTLIRNENVENRIYSSRNALAGSIANARRAGSMQAKNATSDINPIATR